MGAVLMVRRMEKQFDKFETGLGNDGEGFLGLYARSVENEGRHSRCYREPFPSGVMYVAGYRAKKSDTADV